MVRVPWLALLILVGLGLRGYHYLSDPAVWHDEAALVINAVDKSFADHLGPLYFAEAAPPLFLWAEKGISLVLGDSTLALRLFPFLASCAAFVLLVLLSRRLLPPSAVLLFALLLGCSDRLLWHSCEAKPYAVDVFVAALVLLVWSRRRTERITDRTVAGGFAGAAASEGMHPTIGWTFLSVARWRRRTGMSILWAEEAAVRQQPVHVFALGLFTLLAPVLVFLSFPACFLLGGVALTYLPDVWHARKPRLTAAYALFVAALCGSFLLLLLGPIQAQRNEHLEEGWLTLFPDWGRPWYVPLQLAISLVGVCRYACEPIGGALFLFTVVGAAVLWREGNRRLVVVLAWPLLLTCVAWLVSRYPLGPTRVMAFAAPAILLLAAAGCATSLTWLAQRQRLAAGVLLLFLLVPVAGAGYRIAIPWKRAEVAPAVALVRDNRSAGDVVIGTAWEHAWYFRDLADEYRPLLARPHDPSFPPALNGRLDALGHRCWLLVRSDATDAERAALARFRLGQDWTVRRQHSFRRLIVYQLERNMP